MDNCTCIKKSFLHLSDCPVISIKSNNGLFQLQELSFNSPDTTLYYIAGSETLISDRWSQFISSLSANDWIGQIQQENISSIIMCNGAEVVFVPKEEALNIVDAPPSKAIFLENFKGFEDFYEAFYPTTSHIQVVDKNTLNLL
jgi:hypothetical protein